MNQIVVMFCLLSIVFSFPVGAESASAPVYLVVTSEAEAIVPDVFNVLEYVENSVSGCNIVEPENSIRRVGSAVTMGGKFFVTGASAMNVD